MELNELKAKWNELDARLTKVETLNKKALRELVTTRTSSSITHLRTRSWIGCSVTFFVSAFMIYWFGHNEELSQILNPNSIIAMITALVLATAYIFFRTAKISKINVSMPTTELMLQVNKIRRLMQAEYTLSYIAVVALYAIVFFFERGWIIERGRVIPAILLFIGLCVFAGAAHFINKKENQQLLDEIDQNIKELSEL